MFNDQYKEVLVAKGQLVYEGHVTTADQAESSAVKYAKQRKIIIKKAEENSDRVYWRIVGGLKNINCLINSFLFNSTRYVCCETGRSLSAHLEESTLFSIEFSLPSSRLTHALHVQPRLSSRSRKSTNGSVERTRASSGTSPHRPGDMAKAQNCNHPPPE